jgi:LAO/AO transport system kinase
MATRGQLGGLAAATADVVSVLDAAGRDPILIETVGVGQDEVDIVKLADVSVVVLVPGMGDDVQALKAGIMEIGDVFVINKSDRPGADRMEQAVEALLGLAHRADGWVPPIVKTVATDGAGIDELVKAIDACSEQMKQSGAADKKRREAAKQRVLGLVQERVIHSIMESAFAEGLDQTIDKILRREVDPYTVAESAAKAQRG